MIKTVNLKKTYENDSCKTEALRGIDFTVEEGDYIAIMGTSGSGKSTLINILGAMDSLTEGEYFFKDIAVHKLKNKQLQLFRKKHISFIFQQFELMDTHTVYENIEIPMIAQGVSKKERKKVVKECMEVVGIEDLANKLPKHISGGQQQRCAIARALAAKNDLILADEPTGALDKKNSESIMELLDKVNKTGKTIIVITHDENVAKNAKKIIRIEDGKIVE